MKAVINSQKHIVQTTLTTIEEQTVFSPLIVTGIEAQPNAPTEVDVGAVVKAIYFEYWLIGESAQNCTATWTIEKFPSGVATVTQAQMQALHDYPNKNNILKMGQGLIGENNSNPIPVIREWVKIPKGKQRIALGDKFKINISCIGQADNGLDICGFALYKSYQ